MTVKIDQKHCLTNTKREQNGQKKQQQKIYIGMTKKTLNATFKYILINDETRHFTFLELRGTWYLDQKIMQTRP